MNEEQTNADRVDAILAEIDRIDRSRRMESVATVIIMILVLLLSFFAVSAHAEEPPSKTLCDLRDGERGCGLGWAFTGSYPVYPRCRPPGTVQSPTWREGDSIFVEDYENGGTLRELSRAKLGCEPRIIENYRNGQRWDRSGTAERHHELGCEPRITGDIEE